MKRKERDSIRPANISEAQFYDYAKTKGIRITKRGWPDYACFMPDNSLVVVEIKRKRSHRLKSEQLRLMLALSHAGVKCYRWSPDIGFTKVEIISDL